MNINELREVTEAAVEPYKRFMFRGRVAGDDLKLQVYGEKANPQTILAMIELLREIGALLGYMYGFAVGMGQHEYEDFPPDLVEHCAQLIDDAEYDDRSVEEVFFATKEALTKYKEVTK